MMREHLYRGIPKSDSDRHFFADIWKDNCEGSFVYGSLIISNDRYYICVSALCQINCCINNGMTSMIEVIPETVGQYTGLTDKNGKKIFEGDILQVDVQEYKDKTEDFWGELRTNRVFTGKYRKELWTVEYKEHFCKGNGFYGYGKDRRFNINLTKSTLSNVNAEVIGNIHDNPELLKGGEE